MPEKKCFVISPIGDQDSPERKRADDIFFYVLPEVLEPLDYKLDRADLIDSSGLISTQIIQRLKDDSLVIADLAYYNPNVFYELAIRHVTKKPYVQLRLPNQKIPFDLANTRTIAIDTAELKTVKEAKNRIKGHIDHMNEATPNPISSALDELFLQGSTDPTDNSIGEIKKMLSEIGATVGVEKFTIDKQLQEAQLRAKIEINAADRISQPLISLWSSLNVFKSNNDKLSVELQEEVKRIEDACKNLQWLYSSLRRPRTEIHWLSMQKLHNQNKESS